MKPFAQMTDWELIDTADMMVKRLRERLVQVPADFDHHSEMFESEAEELRDLAAYIVEHAIDICLDRMRPNIDDGPLPAPVCDYFEGRSIEDAMTRDPDPIDLFKRQAS